MPRSRVIVWIAALLVTLPLLPVVIWAFAEQWRFPSLWPSAWSLRGFRYLADCDNQVPGAAITSVQIALVVMVVSMLVSVPAGMALGGYRFRGRGIALLLVMLPILVPPLVATLGIHTTFIYLGLADTFMGVFLVHLISAVPYATLIMTSIFAGRSSELEQTARTLGAGPWQAFLHVTLPGIMPGVAVTALLAFLISWSQYVLTVLIGGGSIITLPMLLFSAASGDDPVIAAALALVFALPAVSALVIALKFIVPAKGRPLLSLEQRA